MTVLMAPRRGARPYIKMSKTCSYFHIVFGTKYRVRTMFEEKREKLYQYISGIVKNKKSELKAINGMEDHVHILLNLHPTVSLADIVRDIKSNSSKMIQQTHLFPMFEGWSKEYFACSVSPSHTGSIMEYIRNQQEHHTSKKYQEEMEVFVTKMGFVLYKDDLD